MQGRNDESRAGKAAVKEQAIAAVGYPNTNRVATAARPPEDATFNCFTTDKIECLIKHI